VHHYANVVTGPPNGPILFCSLASVVCRCHLSSSLSVVCNAAGGRAGRPAGRRARPRGPLGGRLYTASQYGYVPL